MKNFTQFWIKPWKYIYTKVKISNLKKQKDYLNLYCKKLF